MKRSIIFIMLMSLCSCVTYKTNDSVIKKALRANQSSYVGVGSLVDELTLEIKNTLAQYGIQDSVATSIALRSTGDIILELRECGCK